VLGEVAVPILQNTEGMLHASSNNTADTNLAIPSGRSIAHFNYAQNNVVFISFNIKTVGEYCGIVQISAEMVLMEVVPIITKKGPSSIKDYAANIRREESTFNQFVKPREGAGSFQS